MLKAECYHISTPACMAGNKALGSKILLNLNMASYIRTSPICHSLYILLQCYSRLCMKDETLLATVALNSTIAKPFRA